MEYVIVVSTAIIAYLIGSISSAVIISKIISGKDIRTEGSGNAGATNMLRVHGKGAGAVTLILDALKGVVAILAAMLLNIWLRGVAPESIFVGNLGYIAGLFAVIGHDFPLFFGFKGGKGVATSLGVIFMLNWQIGLIVLIIAILTMIISRYVSLGSILAAVIYPVLVLVFMIGEKSYNKIYLACIVVMAILLIAKHHGNISRLIKGTENKLFSKKDKE